MTDDDRPSPAELLARALGVTPPPADEWPEPRPAEDAPEPRDEAAH